ncbi:MAG: SAM-dependent methyltransferase [Acidimicrobiia bacterium]
MKRRIIDRIRAEGPMYFDHYMEMCLYDPDGGYFTSDQIRPGSEGDFVTSPEVSPSFGVFVGSWAVRNRHSADASLIEVGAGSGAMLPNLAASWFENGLPVYAVDLSGISRQAINDRCPDANVYATLEEIPQGTDAVVIANEVLDNMPAALARRTSDGWEELAVGTNGQTTELVAVAARPAVADWCEEVFSDPRPGTVVSAQIAVADWITGVLGHLGSAALCLIDYAATARELETRDASAVVRTYLRHKTGLDWLEDPGSSDLTVDVNIDGVALAVRRAGRMLRRMTQQEFLIKHGAAEMVAAALAEERSAAADSRVMDQLSARSERINIEALLDPDGLGGFTVFLIE